MYRLLWQVQQQIHNHGDGMWKTYGDFQIFEAPETHKKIFKKYFLRLIIITYIYMTCIKQKNKILPDKMYVYHAEHMSS